MRTYLKLGMVAVALLTTPTLTACTTSETGRSQFIMMSDAQANAMGADAYKQIKGQKPISRDSRYTRPVVEIGQRLATVSRQNNFQWEFTVFQDKTPNAFALPGGKVGVHTGLFQVAKTKDQLAAVLAHEVAHATNKHSAERVSRQSAVQAGIGILTGGGSSGTAGLMAQAATLGLVLPFSRTQESEADQIGLLYMARAGYDPRAAVDLWRNFASYGGNRPPEFLSTHPNPESRIQRIQEMLPQAMAEYNKSPYR